jgi:hypothetical protein
MILGKYPAWVMVLGSFGCLASVWQPLTAAEVLIAPKLKPIALISWRRCMVYPNLIFKLKKARVE